MAEEASFTFIRSGQWRDVDDTSDPESFVAYLDQVATILRDARPEVVRLLDVSPGCSVLDVGSGAGEFLIELAGSVGGVRAVGIDVSQTMVTTATSRAHAVGAAVQFALGDAQRLDFPDGSFDRVNCSRVLVHVEDPRAVVAEMARVLAPGGRIAIFEPDIDAYLFDSGALDVVTEVRRHLVAGVRNPDIGRRLQRLVLDSGLDLRDVSRVTLGEYDLFGHLENALGAGKVGAGMVDQWRTRIETVDPSGQLRVSPVAVRAVASKPPGAVR